MLLLHFLLFPFSIFIKKWFHHFITLSYIPYQTNVWIHLNECVSWSKRQWVTLTWGLFTCKFGLILHLLCCLFRSTHRNTNHLHGINVIFFFTKSSKLFPTAKNCPTNKTYTFGHILLLWHKTAAVKSKGKIWNWLYLVLFDKHTIKYKNMIGYLKTCTVKRYSQRQADDKLYAKTGQNFHTKHLCWCEQALILIL